MKKYLINQFTLGTVANINYCVVEVLKDDNKVICKQFNELELTGEECEFDIDYLIENAKFAYSKYNRIPQNTLDVHEVVEANSDYIIPVVNYELACDKCNEFIPTINDEKAPCDVCKEEKIQLKNDILNILVDNCWVEEIQ